MNIVYATPVPLLKAYRMTELESVTILEENYQDFTKVILHCINSKTNAKIHMVCWLHVNMLTVYIKFMRDKLITATAQR
jgi:hypothetical protein